MYDLVIRNGIVIDGTGAEGFRADVAVAGERIVAVGNLGPVPAVREIGAEGRVVAPGFVDPHTHSDFTLVQGLPAESKLRQGVTTEIGGNCGYSLFPVAKENLPALRGSTGFFPGALSWQWSDYGDVQEELRRVGLASNFASLAGHGMIRIAAMGFSAGPPGPGELGSMADHLRKALDQGCVGLSMGLAYAPGCYAGEEELVALGRIVRSYRGGMITVHLRDEGDGVLASVAEMIRIAERTGVPVHIAHLKAAGRKNWGRVEEVLGMIDGAATRGVDVTCDVYPYTAANTMLTALFPRESLSAGVDGLLKRLEDPGEREPIRGHLRSEAGALGGWDRIRIATVRTEGNRRWEGKTAAEMAAERGIDEAEALIDLCRDEAGSVNIVLFYVDEADLERVMCHPRSMFGSDGKALAVEGPLAMGKPHPRNYGAYPRVLGRYVRERKTLALPEAIRKMTSVPADRFSLEGRGRIREGAFADLVVFDPGTVADRSTFDHPQQYPTGIEVVAVNGQVVLEQGSRTGAFPGKILRNR
jgi:N-acyl-D-amino-acid deacylase